MVLSYNLEPLDAMDLYYSGEKNGIWDGEFIKNEKTRGLIFPPVLKKFWKDYGYLDVNQNKDSFRFFIPDDMDEIRLQTGTGEVPILIIGVFRDYVLGIRRDTEDLQAAFGERTEDGTMWSPVSLNFSGILATMLVSLLFQSEKHIVCDDADAIDAELAKYGAQRSLLRPSAGCPQHFSLNYISEKNLFLIAEFDAQGGDITMLHVVPGRELTLDELEQMFQTEFYQNSTNCDFQHALELQLKIIGSLEKPTSLELAEHYKLAARCCWELGQFDEAASWYDKGLVEVKNNIADAFHKEAGYYQAMGNFYADTGQYDKSDQYYEKGLDTLRQHFPDDAYQIGQIYQSHAQFLARHRENLDRAITLYDKALEEFQKKPKDCKYDIARTQQLRGEAKRLKKG